MASKRTRRPWSPLPRYIFRKRNAHRLIAKLSGPRTFLEAGCGAGDFACSLVKRRKMRGIGFDFSEQAIETAKRMAECYGLDEDEMEFRVGDFGAFEEQVDLVISFEVLEHVKDDHAAFRQIAECSRRYVLISVPAHRKLYSHSDKLVGHYRRYDRRDIEALFHDNDVKLTQCITYGFPFTNVLRWLRDGRAKKLMKTTELNSPEAQSAQSGLNMLRMGRVSQWVLNEVTLAPLVAFSRLFNRSSLGEGFLALGERISQAS